MIRRFGMPPTANRRFIRRPGAYALLPLNGELLLTCQFSPEPDLQLPGGGIDPGESPIPALHREVFEETGWRISAPRRLGVFRRFAYMPEYDLWAEKICTVFVARPISRIGPPSEPNHEAVWIPVDSAARVLGNSGDRHFTSLFASGVLR